MSVTNIFESTLMATKHRGLSDAPPPSLEDDEQYTEDDQAIYEILTCFAGTLTDDELLEDSDSCLEELFDQFCAGEDISDETTIHILKGALVETAFEAYDSRTDDAIRGVLQVLRTAPKTTTTTPNKPGSGMEPHPKGTVAFLRQLKVLKHGDPFGNDDVFAGKDVKTFDRVKNRYGHPNVDFNKTPPGRSPLSNPILNVSVKESYRAVDAVGLGVQNQWRVVGPDGAYITKQIDRLQAEQIASELNQEQAVLGEQRIASTDLQESLQTPRDNAKMARYEAALKRPNYTMAGSIAQSGPASPVADLKAAALLVERRKAAFHEDDLNSDELTAIHSKQRTRR